MSRPYDEAIVRPAIIRAFSTPGLISSPASAFDRYLRSFGITGPLESYPVLNPYRQQDGRIAIGPGDV